MKRISGRAEAVFDGCYLLLALLAGCVLLLPAGASGPRRLAGVMALTLVCGDACHLIPRMCAAVLQREEALRPALGRGKQIVSVTMTLFYVLLWQLCRMLFAVRMDRLWTGAVFGLAATRILLCMLPQNRWQQRYPPVKWSIYRNLPFFLMGAATAAQFFIHRFELPALRWMWLAIALSFAFYLPVALLSGRFAKIGMLMLPKTCAYLWMLSMCLGLS